MIFLNPRCSFLNSTTDSVHVYHMSKENLMIPCILLAPIRRFLYKHWRRLCLGCIPFFHVGTKDICSLCLSCYTRVHVACCKWFSRWRLGFYYLVWELFTPHFNKRPWRNQSSSKSSIKSHLHSPLFHDQFSYLREDSRIDLMKVILLGWFGP